MTTTLFSKIITLAITWTTLCYSSPYIKNLSSGFSNSTEYSIIVPSGNFVEFKRGITTSVSEISPSTNIISNRVDYYSEFTVTAAGAGLAAAFNPGLSYTITFDVDVAPGVEYTLNISRINRGYSNVSWNGYTQGSALVQAAGVSYAPGLVTLNSVLQSGPSIATYINRYAGSGNSEPGMQFSEFLGQTSTQTFAGPKSFVLNVEGSSQHLFQNYNHGHSALNFGREGILGSHANGASQPLNELGDFLSVTISLKQPPILAPTISIAKELNGLLRIDFVGIIQKSVNLIDWITLDPQPITPYLFSPEESKVFFRSVTY